MKPVHTLAEWKEMLADEGEMTLATARAILSDVANYTETDPALWKEVLGLAVPLPDLDDVDAIRDYIETDVIPDWLARGWLTTEMLAARGYNADDENANGGAE